MELAQERRLDDLANKLAGLGLELTDEDIMAEAVEDLGSIEAVEAEAKRIARAILDAFPPA